MSSAKQSNLRDEHLLMSLMYIKNKIGPRIDPWGTPVFIFRCVD